MRVPDFTVEHLKQLPLRAIVAFAARCGRRVEARVQWPERDPELEVRRAAIDAALRMADDFARGADDALDPSILASIDAMGTTGIPLGIRSAAAAAAGAAHAAASACDALLAREVAHTKPMLGDPADAKRFVTTLAHVTVDLAALDAFTAAVEAYGAFGYHNEGFVAAALNDYERLLQLKLGRYPEQGEPIDPSPRGPLGRL